MRRVIYALVCLALVVVIFLVGNSLAQDEKRDTYKGMEESLAPDSTEIHVDPPSDYVYVVSIEVCDGGEFAVRELYGSAQNISNVDAFFEQAKHTCPGRAVFLERGLPGKVTYVIAPDGGCMLNAMSP